jgi:hypothetical protein
MWKPDTKRIAETVESAPSIFNSKPWWLDPVAEDRIDLHAKLDGVDRQRWDQWVGRRGIQHPEWLIHHPQWLAREIAISCGAALYNLRLAIRVAGHDLTVWLVPDPERDTTLLASVEIVTGRIKKPTIAEQELYEAIWRRLRGRPCRARRPSCVYSATASTTGDPGTETGGQGQDRTADFPLTRNWVLCGRASAAGGGLCRRLGVGRRPGGRSGIGPGPSGSLRWGDGDDAAGVEFLELADQVVLPGLGVSRLA